MNEFERHWLHTEREQHARLLNQLKREMVAKRQAEQAQAKLPRTTQSPQEASSESLPPAATATESTRPLQKRPAAHLKQPVRSEQG